LIQEKRQFINLAAESSNFKANFDKRLIDAFKLDGLFTYSLERIKQSGSANVLDNQTLMIGSVSPGVRVDLRDNALAPTKGFFSILSFDYASAALGSQQDPFPVSYWRSQFRMDQTIPIGNLISWSLSFRTGFEKNLIDPHQLNNGSGDLRVGIPVTKQFSLGGAGSMRGYKLQEINYEGIAQTDVIAQGTLSFVNYRTQVDFPLSDALRAGPFLDAGNLSSNRFRFGNLRYGVGFGVRYITPVGPVNFDWGFKIAPRANEDPYNFYFSIGVL
jgi:outer membrane protein insertion porin family